MPVNISWYQFMSEGKHEELPAGIIVCLNADEHFLIIRRSDADEREGQWTIPGGHIDSEDVSVQAGAQRELKEETNLHVNLEDMQYIGMPKPKKYYYLAFSWEGELKIDIPNPKTGIVEHNDYKWATIKEIKGLDNTEIPIYLLEEALEIYKEHKK
tara:strand:- start:183 stop:650 length:468 start_codon:yes stop_codon:yes gene_type:complete